MKRVAFKRAACSQAKKQEQTWFFCGTERSSVWLENSVDSRAVCMCLVGEREGEAKTIPPKARIAERLGVEDAVLVWVQQESRS